MLESIALPIVLGLLADAILTFCPSDPEACSFLASAFCRLAARAMLYISAAANDWPKLKKTCSY